MRGQSILNNSHVFILKYIEAMHSPTKELLACTGMYSAFVTGFFGGHPEVSLSNMKIYLGARFILQNCPALGKNIKAITKKLNPDAVGSIDKKIVRPSVGAKAAQIG